MKMEIEELKKWLRDKSVRRWKRILFLMYDEGEPMSFDEIAESIGANRSSVYRLLKKLEIEGVIKSEEKKKHKVWILTNKGEMELFSLQKRDMIPTRK